MLQWKIYLPLIRSTVERFAQEAQNSDCFARYDSSYTKIINEQKEKLLNVFNQFDTNEENEAIEDYLEFCIYNDLPYLFVHSELSNIAREILGLLASEGKCSSINYANIHFTNLETRIAKEYYHHFLRKLATKHHIRLSHLSHLIEKHLMIHYQHHLEWMLVLISELQGTQREGSSCELDHTRCSFGQWLHNPSIPYLSNTSHFSDIQRLHINLHELASNIFSQRASEQIDYKNIIQLLQNLDYTSLEIGNEIAIINDMLIIGEYTKDPLTGLLGRRLFEKIVMGQVEIAKATESDCSMIMCDLDYFKEINDQYGHLSGDEVIKNFAHNLQKTLRKSDFIFRFGGEEFLVLLPSTNYSEARQLAEKLCLTTATQKVHYENNSINYTVSIGVYEIDTRDLTFVTKNIIQHYIQAVDTKLYLAKENGRNRVE
ncbi:MAG: sensor domain-containing diguanylate cyclase [Sulfuricurvum sp.]|uniref:GGDEF domain-containing protein n=1 Tax=Sulfuricurvum sp. TaxID=2025608 RepID=UPI002606DB05|nr:sensor domain-containing diguanylate cyclase [Sulfuricurvum sp.]MDD2829125.1 sensor domain-containing diguanylate cyclase [Sulfuricurvum sp.]MDD4950174.1 sensor domain-containing diguanylate cyclase [Sulfuricurvum sp.]